MSDVQTPQSTQTQPQAGNSYLGNLFLGIVKGTVAVAAGVGVAALAPVAIGAAAVIGTAGYAAYAVGSAARGPSTPQRATDEDASDSEAEESDTEEDDATAAKELSAKAEKGEDPAATEQASREKETEEQETEEPETGEARQQAEAKRIAAEKAEAERVAAAKEAEKVAAEKAEAERVAAEEAKKAAAERIVAEKLAADRAAAQKLAAKKAAAEKAAAEQVKLRKAADTLLAQVNGQKKVTDPRATPEETEKLEAKREAIRGILKADILTNAAIEDAKVAIGELEVLLKSVGAEIKRRGDEDRAAARRKQEEQAAEQERVRQEEAAAEAARAAAAWRNVAQEATIVLRDVDAALRRITDVVDACGMTPLVVRDKEALEVRLEAGKKSVPSERDGKAAELLARKLKDWEASVTGGYLGNSGMVANLGLAISSKAKGFEKERGKLIAALMSTETDPGSIASAYGEMIAVEGPWTPAQARPARQAKQKPVRMVVANRGLGDLMDMLPECVTPTEITYKLERNGRNSFYKYANGAEIHVHRNRRGEATKAHIKMTSNQLTMGTAQDNDIPTTDLTDHGIDETEHPVKGKVAT